jgi:putative inorganic carbon (HCO3(-)) transporter
MALIDVESGAAVATAGAARTNEERATRIAFALTFASAAAIMVSIAASQILMGAALLAVLLSRQRLRIPPFFRSILLFLAITVIADLASGDPRAGLPQIRKIYVFAIAVLAYAFLRKASQITALVLAWAALGFASALVGLHQFLARLAEGQRLHWNIYEYVLDKRMTGFASHWMTFGGEQMIALLMLTSLLLFGRLGRWKFLGWVAWSFIAASLVLGMTRSVYLVGFPTGLIWLLWKRRKIFACVVPLLFIAGFLAVPGHVRERIVSAVHPHGEVDSNGRRIIMARAGWAMIRSHPFLGIGPEQPGLQFAKYLPADVPRPLPKGWYGHLHNFYLQYAAERGVPALFVLLWAIIAVARSCIRAARSDNAHADAQRAWILHGTVAAILAVLAEGLFEHNLGDSEVLTMFLTVIACGSAISVARSDDLCA